MKISSRSTGSAMPMHDPHFVPEPAFSELRHAVRALFLTLDQMGTAIALGEAGDLEGAKALRMKHAVQRT